MAVGILELVGLDAGRGFVRFGNGLRCAGDALDRERAQVLVGALHVAHHHREVLEPQIVRAAVDRDRLTAGREVLLELDLLVAELQRRAAHARAEHAGQIVEVAVGDDALADLLESERLLVESDGAVQVGDRQRKAADLARSGEHRAGEQRQSQMPRPAA